MASRIAYFVNQYPKVSHTFIRREILSLERHGFEVLRVALRGWDAALADPEDERERGKTRYVLREGLVPLVWAALRTLVAAPGRFLRAAALAMRMGWRAERPLPYHFVYLAEACRMLPWLRAHGATHLHAHFGTNSAQVAMLAHVLGGPAYSFTVHGPEEFDKAPFLGLDEKIRRAAFVVAVSSFGRSQLYRWVEHQHWAKVHVVRCGLEDAFYAFDPVPVPAAPRLVCVGRLSEQKGQLLLLEAVDRLARTGLELELVLVGDGEMRPEVERLIGERGLAGRVRITGWVGSEQVRREIWQARGLVLASFAEGLPVVLMEAMALRRPVLATSVAGIPELVRPGESGWLVCAGSLDELARAMTELVTSSVEELTRMGEAAYRRVLERHSVEVETRKLAALIRDPAARSAPAR